LVCTNKTKGVTSQPEDRRMSSPAANRYISFLLSRIESRMFSTTVLYVDPRFNFFFLRQAILYIVFCDYSWSIQPTSEYATTISFHIFDSIHANFLSFNAT
jgi:hypothetical protein